jgi:hypothetical protein
LTVGGNGQLAPSFFLLPLELCIGTSPSTPKNLVPIEMPSDLRERRGTGREARRHGPQSGHRGFECVAGVHS